MSLLPGLQGRLGRLFYSLISRQALFIKIQMNYHFRAHSLYISQAGLQFTAILLLDPPQCLHYRPIVPGHQGVSLTPGHVCATQAQLLTAKSAPLPVLLSSMLLGLLCECLKLLCLWSRSWASPLGLSNEMSRRSRIGTGEDDLHEAH